MTSLQKEPCLEIETVMVDIVRPEEEETKSMSLSPSGSLLELSLDKLS